MAQRIDHKKFTELIEAISKRSAVRERIIITPDEMATIVEHWEWFKTFIAGKKKASKSRVNPGRKPQPDAEIQPESLRRRELRKKK